MFSVGVFGSQVLAAILKPVLPDWAAKVERFLNLPAPLDFVNATVVLPDGHALLPYETLDAARNTNDDFDNALRQIEEYLTTNGSPYCDYTRHRVNRPKPRLHP